LDSQIAHKLIANDNLGPFLDKLRRNGETNNIGGGRGWWWSQTWGKMLATIIKIDIVCFEERGYHLIHCLDWGKGRGGG
jgi:hypothetical protein